MEPLPRGGRQRRVEMALNYLYCGVEIQVVDVARGVVPGDEAERVFRNEEGVRIVISLLKLVRGKCCQSCALAVGTPQGETRLCARAELPTETAIRAMVGTDDWYAE
jgi:hypothetical protein